LVTKFVSPTFLTRFHVALTKIHPIKLSVEIDLIVPFYLPVKPKVFPLREDEENSTVTIENYRTKTHIEILIILITLKLPIRKNLN
jgi:hypothetical protein